MSRSVRRLFFDLNALMTTSSAGWKRAVVGEVGIQAFRQKTGCSRLYPGYIPKKIQQIDAQTKIERTEPM